MSGARLGLRNTASCIRSRKASPVCCCQDRERGWQARSPGGSRWPGAWPTGPDVVALTQARRCPVRGSCAGRVPYYNSPPSLPPRAALGERPPALHAIGLGREVPAGWDLRPDGLRLRSRVCDVVALPPEAQTQQESRPHGQDSAASWSGKDPLYGNRSVWEEAAGEGRSAGPQPRGLGQGDHGAQESKGSVFTPEAQTHRDTWRPF